MIELVFEGPTIAWATATAVTRAMPPMAQTPGASARRKKMVVGADFELALAPTRAIDGTVRDAKTGEALAGVAVVGLFDGGPHPDQQQIRTVSDAQGHFHLVGMPKGAAGLVAVPNDKQPYLIGRASVPDGPGIDPARVDIRLHRGIWITGRVTDEVTGAPVRPAQILYLPFLSNEFAKGLPEFEEGAGTVSILALGPYLSPRPYQVAADGSYRLVGLPGPAIVGIVATGFAVHVYPPGQGASEIQGMNPQGSFPTYRSEYRFPDKQWPTAMREINPAGNSDSVQLDFALDRGGQVEITTVDPAGQPIAGVSVIGIGAAADLEQSTAAPTFLATSLGPTEERTILLRNKSAHWARLSGCAATSKRKRSRCSWLRARESWGAARCGPEAARGRRISLRRPSPRKAFYPYFRSNDIQRADNHRR